MDGNHSFYISRAWRKVRAEVLKEDKYECQICKSRGVYSLATHVHHINHLDDRPDLALVKTMPDGSRNLISLCWDCHEEQHPERMRQNRKNNPVTVEKW